jgi:uncharacterized protein with von Willebrand factor type A (vWA) domain
MRKGGFVFSITDSAVENLRDLKLDQIESNARARRCQPPMIDRLRTITVLVDHLQREGIPFATSRNSRMNKAVRKWINEKTAASSDPRKSRRKQLSADGVQELLKQVSKLR